MTTAASFTSLQAPLADDNMEMSSPAHPVYEDDDIDIDFDESIGGVELADDDRMADDTEQPRPGTATDDMMEDDAPPQNAQAPEQEMQDEFDPAAYEQGDPDDELIDYDDEVYQDMSEVKEDTATEPAAPEITLQDREPTDPGFEQVDEEIVREPEISAPAQEVLVEESAPELVTAVLETSAPEVIAVPVADESFAEAVNGTDDHTGAETEANAAADDAVATTDDQHRETTPVVDPAEEPFPELPEDSPELKASAPIPAPIETNLDAGNDAPPTPTDTGLHPMFVQYGEWHWPLFKSKRQPEGLLNDDNLASVALADLLNSCRSRLALKAGEDVSENQEFVLQFDKMGLTIIENSPSAFNTSLDEVLAVFRQLHVNDRAQSIPPFWMYLSSQVNPSKYFAELKRAAGVGLGISYFSDVPADEMPDEEYEDYYGDGDEGPTLLGDTSGFENEGEAQADDHHPHAEPEFSEADVHEYDTSHENTEGGQESHDRDDQYDEVQQAEFDAQQAEYDRQQAEDQTQQAAHEAQQAEFEAYEDNEGQYTVVAAEHAEEANDAQQSEEAEDTSHVVEDTVPSHETKPSVTASAPEASDNPTGEARDGEDGDKDTAKTSNVESAAAVDNHKENSADHDDEFSNFLADNELEKSADVDITNKESTRTVETNNTNIAIGEEYDDAADGHDDTADAADIDFGVDNTEDHTEEAGQDAPIDAVANGEVQEQPETQASANGIAGSTSELRGTPEAEQPHAKVSPSEKPVRNDEDYIDFGEDEDGIDFDDDTYEEHEARKASEANSPSSQSPSGKRPLDEAGHDEQPELKKVKSS